MSAQTMESIIEEIIDATKSKVCLWDASQAFFGFYRSRMNGVSLILWNLQDETSSLVFEEYGTYKGGQILRNLVSAVLEQFPAEPARYPSHSSLPDPTALLHAWAKVAP